jgi:hypothetical protein
MIQIRHLLCDLIGNLWALPDWQLQGQMSRKLPFVEAARHRFTGARRLWQSSTLTMVLAAFL